LPERHHACKSQQITVHGIQKNSPPNFLQPQRPVARK
jgi:hypothetical protein